MHGIIGHPCITRTNQEVHQPMYRLKPVGNTFSASHGSGALVVRIGAPYRRHPFAPRRAIAAEDPGQWALDWWSFCSWRASPVVLAIDFVKSSINTGRGP